MPKAAVLDPQGNAVRDAMQHLGMPEVRSVRIGKYMEIDIDGHDGDLETRLRGLCRDLLSNPVIEDYQLDNVETAKRAGIRFPKSGMGQRSRGGSSATPTGRPRTSPKARARGARPSIRLLKKKNLRGNTKTRKRK